MRRLLTVAAAAALLLPVAARADTAIITGAKAGGGCFIVQTVQQGGIYTLALKPYREAVTPADVLHIANQASLIGANIGKTMAYNTSATAVCLDPDRGNKPFEFSVINNLRVPDDGNHD